MSIGPDGTIGFGVPGGGADINRLHDYDDKDIGILAHHHTLGINYSQASPGDHVHDGIFSKKLALSARGNKNANTTTITTITEIVRTAPALVLIDALTSVEVIGSWDALIIATIGERARMRLQWSNNAGGAWTSFAGCLKRPSIITAENGGTIMGVHTNPGKGSYLYRLTGEKAEGASLLTVVATTTELVSISAKKLI